MIVVQPAQGAGSRWTRSARRSRASRCSIADDGEILVRGELVMHGYWRNDAETNARPAATAGSYTGDIGRDRREGRIKITDRKKDIIVNDKGDNVAPQKVEGMLTLAARDRPGDDRRRQEAPICRR